MEQMDQMDHNEQDPALLFDEQTLEIAGERIVVREYRYLQGLRAAAIARPLLEGLRALIEDLAGPEALAPEALDALIGEHHETWLALIALCIDRPVEWVAALPDAEGQRLGLAFWAANAGFFMRRLVVARAVREGLRSPSPKSSTSSSAPATEPTTTTSPRATPGASSAATTPSPSSAGTDSAPT